MMVVIQDRPFSCHVLASVKVVNSSWIVPLVALVAEVVIFFLECMVVIAQVLFISELWLDFFHFICDLSFDSFPFFFCSLFKLDFSFCHIDWLCVIVLTEVDFVSLSCEVNFCLSSCYFELEIYLVVQNSGLLHLLLL